MAIGLRKSGRRVWVLLGDGECQEGQVWEAAMLAGLCKLANLHAVVDVNRYQEFGWRLAQETHVRIDPVPELAAKWRSFGWNVVECDGHDLVTLEREFAAIADRKGPSVVLASTKKGQGSALAMQDPGRFHCTDVNEQEHATILSELKLS
jgi:transketolase